MEFNDGFLVWACLFAENGGEKPDARGTHTQFSPILFVCIKIKS